MDGDRRTTTCPAVYVCDWLHVCDYVSSSTSTSTSTLMQRLTGLVQCSGQAFPTLSITVGIEESESDFSYCIYVSGVCVTTFSLTQQRSLTAMEPSSGGQAAVTKCRPVVTKVTGDS
ncbi:hypothetical protein EYF80_027055 [Liparis tanakae]|uniref:Uncharacterized protein n=1 Tax=Liparis tanakae TaxID=230148 RepID=A0A4Z2HCH5_9TELE|nr:hypothetical protein EYF80_027055 [Liparis tanakae]